LSAEFKGRWKPRIAYHHPLLERKNLGSSPDDKLHRLDGPTDPGRGLIDAYVECAGRVTRRLAFSFVDIKGRGHGYLLHEFFERAETAAGKIWAAIMEGPDATLVHESLGGIRDKYPRFACPWCGLSIFGLAGRIRPAARWVRPMGRIASFLPLPPTVFLEARRR